MCPVRLPKQEGPSIGQSFLECSSRASMFQVRKKPTEFQHNLARLFKREIKTMSRIVVLARTIQKTAFRDNFASPSFYCFSQQLHFIWRLPCFTLAWRPIISEIVVLFRHLNRFKQSFSFHPSTFTTFTFASFGLAVFSLTSTSSVTNINKNKAVALIETFGRTFWSRFELILVIFSSQHSIFQATRNCKLRKKWHSVQTGTIYQSQILAGLKLNRKSERSFLRKLSATCDEQRSCGLRPRPELRQSEFGSGRARVHLGFFLGIISYEPWNCSFVVFET